MRRWYGFSRAVLVVAGLSAAASAADGVDAFRERVEPILTRRCGGCHSHAAATMEGGLALDSRSGWATGGSRGPAIVPGDPDGSLLIRAVRHVDPDLRMPEEGPLPPEEVAILEAWVAAGAADPRTAPPPPGAARDWWSLRPLERPVVPAGPHPVDAFVDARLVAEGLAPAGEADRRTLARRLFHDLHGLPPTPEEVAAFVDDPAPDAVDRLVERLLESPRYGERWARHWLDAIHFADTHGYEHDALRPHAWRYRDYVVDRFNRDVPWDRFIREQLAADAFFADAPELTVALGFLGAGPYDHSAAATAPMSAAYLERDDLVVQTLGGFASTTAQCARCHAHKFDPITQEDYFSLQAVFAGVGRGDVSFDADPAVGVARRRFTALLAAANARDAAVLLVPDNERLVAAWESARGGGSAWRPLVAETFLSSGGATLARQPDDSILSGGMRPEVDTVTVTAPLPVRTLSALRLDVLPDATLPMQGPGRQDNGNLHLSEVVVQLFRPGAETAETLAIADATADFDQSGWTIRHAIDGVEKTAWGIYPAVGVAHHAVFVFAAPLEVPADARLAVGLRQLHGGGHLIGRFRLSVTDGPPEQALALDAMAVAALERPSADRDEAARVALAAAVLGRHAARELAALPPQVQVFAAGSQGVNQAGPFTIPAPREIRVLARGDLEKPGAVAVPGALTAVGELAARFTLPQPDDEPRRRAALADWLADPRNPLTWRSIANRVWQHHFGRGICDTPNDFGRMGRPPSHPELLDHLACEIRDGGSLKRVHRLICTSVAYRRSSAATPEQLARDPDGRLLGFRPRQRIDADSFFDAVLATSGRLDLAMGGPGIQHFSSRPGPQITPVLDYAAFDWDATGAGRRAIYRVVWRGIPDPLFDALDFPDLGLPAPVRGFSASAPQALVLFNDPFVLHHAAALARRAEAAAEVLADRVRQAVRLTWLRDPTAAEEAELVALADAHGLPAVCRLLYNSDEFLFLD